MNSFWKTNNDMSKAIEILKSHFSTTPSNWRGSAEWRKANKQWLRKSQKIALAILNCMDIIDINQKQLADKMDVSSQYVSKILKGSENLSLETISKIESVLNIELISVNSFSIIQDVSTNVGNYYTPTNFEPIGKLKSTIQVPFGIMATFNCEQERVA